MAEPFKGDAVGHVNVLESLLRELGMTWHEFEGERSRFEMSPRSWMHERLAKLGYVPAAAVERLIAERAGKAA